VLGEGLIGQTARVHQGAALMYFGARAMGISDSGICRRGAVANEIQKNLGRAAGGGILMATRVQDCAL